MMLKYLLGPRLLHFMSGKPSTVTYTSTSKLSSKSSNTPRPPKDPPDEGYAPECVNHEGFEVADFVRPEAYRQFSGADERLGPGAGNNKEYKNAQYFGYHRFSFMELQNQSIELRNERRVSGGVQVLPEVDEQDECPDNSLETMKQQEAECDLQLACQAKDIENEKLNAECEALNKKQKEIAELQLANKSGKEGVENKSQQINKDKSTMDKKDGEHLKECEGEQKQGLHKEEPKKDLAKVNDCKETVTKSTDPASMPAYTKIDTSQEGACKETSKAESAPKESEQKCIEPKENEAKTAPETSNENPAVKQDVRPKEIVKTEDAPTKEDCKPNDNIEKGGNEKKDEKVPNICETDKDDKHQK